MFILPEKLARKYSREIISMPSRVSLTEAPHTLYFLQIKLIDENFATGGVCGKCLFWKIASAITWGNFFIHGKNVAHLIDSGMWMPGLGANLTDAMFPHVAHGFRGISVPVATYHVCKDLFPLSVIERVVKSVLSFQNPPWQTVSLTNAGEKEYGGLIFDVIKYLGKKLNFTYTVLSPASNRTVKFTRNETTIDVVKLYIRIINLRFHRMRYRNVNETHFSFFR